MCTPPRTIGSAHSLTDCSQTDVGSFRMVSGDSPCRFQPQSHDDHVGRGISRMDALFDGRVDLGNHVCFCAFSAAGTTVRLEMRPAVGQVFGGGDREDAGKIRNFAKDIFQCSWKSIPGRPVGSYTTSSSLPRGFQPARDACSKKLDRHRPRLVHVQIDSDVVSTGPLDDPSQVGQTRRVTVRRIRGSCGPPGASWRRTTCNQTPLTPTSLSRSRSPAG